MKERFNNQGTSVNLNQVTPHPIPVWVAKFIVDRRTQGLSPAKKKA
jgi:hypothetical protein